MFYWSKNMFNASNNTRTYTRNGSSVKTAEPTINGNVNINIMGERKYFPCNKPPNTLKH